MRIWLFAVALILLAPIATAADMQGGAARLDGHWKLDWNRSESYDLVMEVLEVSWLLRKLAGVVPIDVVMRALPAECEGCADRLLLKVHSPIASQEVQVTLDGIARPGEDLRGRATIDSFSWTSERRLEMIREFELPSGSHARLVDTRYLAADSDTLMSQLRVWVDGSERASVLRAFGRLKD